jgi:hypothetical protein
MVLEHFALRQGWQKRSIELLKMGLIDSSDIFSNALEESVIRRVAHYQNRLIA